MNSPRRWRGAALVELALVLIPLMIIVFGITEFGRVLYQENTLTKSVTVGARHITRAEGLLDRSDCSVLDATRWAAVQEAAANLVVCGEAAGCGDRRAVVRGLHPGLVTIPAPERIDAAPGRAACRVVVAAEVEFDALFGQGVVPFTGIGRVVLNARTEERWIGG